MSLTTDQELEQLRRASAELRKERDAALAELQARTAALAARNSEYGERIEHQAATVDVLKAMSASPDDTQPVFDLIVRRAQELCNGTAAALLEYDGQLVHFRSEYGSRQHIAPDVLQAYKNQYPMAPTPTLNSHRALLEKRIIHVRDMDAEPEANEAARVMGWGSEVQVPLLRGGECVGVMALVSAQKGGISDTQIELLKTFAEQAVIAIISAETYRALQTRTSDLRESLEYQTATSDVLKVISRSTFDLEPVLLTLLTTAARLCDADSGGIAMIDGDGLRVVTHFSRDGSHLSDLSFIRGRWRPLDRTSLVGRTALTKGIVHIADVGADPEYIDLTGAEQLASGTMLGVPLLREGVVLGVIRLAHDQIRPFTERHIELVSIFADQAVIAIENTRLITEQREALEQQTATAEVLQVINASPGNLTPVFDAMLEKAMRLCAATSGALFIAHGEVVAVVQSRNIPPAFRDYLEREPPRLDGASLLSRSMREQTVLNVADLRETVPFRERVSLAVAAVELGGIRSIYWVPLVLENRALGLFAIFRQEVRPFSEKQVTLVENFAAQAVIAMENARLITETREALEQQTATAEVLGVINASPGNLGPVFEAMLDKAMQLCQANFGAIGTFDGNRVKPIVFRGVPAAYVDYAMRNPLSDAPETIVGRILRGESIIHIQDLMVTAAYRDGHPDRRALVDLGGARTCLSVALRKEGTLLGMISFYRQDARLFSERQIALLENFAAQAVIAMENARLLNEVRQRQEELRITFENMGDGVAMFDETQRLVAWNGKFQEILDLPDTLPEQHRTYEEFLRFLAARGDFGAGVDTVEQVHALVASTGQPYGYERTRPDGRVIEIRRNPVPDGGFVLMYSDITERKRSEAEIRAARDAAEAALRELKAAQANLIQAEKMASLGQLTAGIAHEIKNPLNFVNNFAELSGDLLDELQDAVAGNLQAEIDELTATLKGNLARIAEHGKRADGIVKAMLEHSRGASGERRSVDLNTLADEALNLAYHGARAQDQSFGITLQRNFAAGIDPIELTPQDITRVLLNLFSNGFYATRKRQDNAVEAGFEPTLQVTTCDLGDAVEIRVRDNGIGIPADIRDKLFQPFFTTKPTGEGTGLGLSISYDIVTKQHGGSVSVDSTVGEFSEFAIRLPRKS